MEVLRVEGACGDRKFLLEWVASMLIVRLKQEEWMEGMCRVDWEEERLGRQPRLRQDQDIRI